MGKRIAIAVAVTLLVLLAGMFAQSHLFTAHPTPTPIAVVSATAIPTPEIAPRVIASDVRGDVQRLRKTSSEDWTALKNGDELTQDDSVRTRQGGIAILELGSAATVTVAEDSQVRVAEISRRTSRVRLEEGRLSAVVHGKEQDSSLKVEFKDSDAVVEAKSGSEFGALTANGQVEVATEKGTVSLEAKGARIDIAAGQTSIVAQNQSPSAPQQVQASLFLKLGSSPRKLTVKKTTVQGTSTPGALITVNGVRAIADHKGAFSTVVPLSDGKNTLVVRAVDVRGRTTTASLASILVDTKPATVGGKVKW
jgi:hypothetical protein